MKIESNKNWTTCLRLNTGDGSPRVFLLNSHFLGSVPKSYNSSFFLEILEIMHYLLVLSDNYVKIVNVNLYRERPNYE